VKLIQEGWFQKHIADFAYETAIRKQDGLKPVIGVNKYVEKEEKVDIEIHPHDPTTEKRQIDRLQRVRRERDNAKVQQLLEKLVATAKDESQNMLPVTIELVREGASMGDIVEKLKTVWGTYRETPVF
jgi:methylmalonyl-CoA mutase N-terminal domain/subunit